MVDLSDGERAGIVGLVRKEAKEWVRSRHPVERIRGITLLGGLRLKDAAPIAKGLFRDKTPTGYVSQAGLPAAEIYGVQAAAALAMARLLGREAIPIIEREIPEANWYMKDQLAEALEKARQAR
jgi:hypothetical protein